MKTQFLTPDIIRKILIDSQPQGHFEFDMAEALEHADLGLGWLYYSFVRVIKPLKVVSIGSLRGFVPICLGLAINHNKKGKLDFIDAAIVDDFWKKDNVYNFFESFGIDKNTIRVITKRTSDVLSDFPEYTLEPSIDILFIDGDHSFEGVKYDFQGFGDKVKSGGYILLHDSFVGGPGYTEWEVADFIGTLGIELTECLTIPIAQGLTIIRKVDATAQLSDTIKSIRNILNSDFVSNLVVDQKFNLKELFLDILSMIDLYETRIRYLLKSNSDLRQQRDLAQMKLDMSQMKGVYKLFQRLLKTLLKLVT